MNVFFTGGDICRIWLINNRAQIIWTKTVCKWKNWHSVLYKFVQIQQFWCSFVHIMCLSTSKVVVGQHIRNSFLVLMNTDPSTIHFRFLREQWDFIYSTVINRNAIQVWSVLITSSADSPTDNNELIFTPGPRWIGELWIWWVCIFTTKMRNLCWRELYRFCFGRTHNVMWSREISEVEHVTFSVFYLIEVLIWRSTCCWKPRLNQTSGSKVMNI